MTGQKNVGFPFSTSHGNHVPKVDSALGVLPEEDKEESTKGHLGLAEIQSVHPKSCCNAESCLCLP